LTIYKSSRDLDKKVHVRQECFKQIAWLTQAINAGVHSCASFCIFGSAPALLRMDYLKTTKANLQFKQEGA
jgi:hypothetical protein